MKVPAKHKHQIAMIEKEIDGYFMYTKNGFCFDDIGLHVKGFDTQKQIKDSIKYEIQVCNCPDCIKHKMNWIK